VNARDAMPDGGEIVVSLASVGPEESPEVPAASDAFARIQVRDDGQGIPEDVRQKILEPFFTTKTRGHGTGLGLAIVNSIVKSHQGWLDVQSQVGQGTSVSVYLPEVPAPKETPMDQKPTSQPSARGESVLFAEDNRLVRGLITSELKSLGYQLETAVDGADCLRRFQREPDRFDLVILDVDMPKLSGPGCLEQIRRLRADVPALLITGQAEDLGELDEFTELLRKPFQIHHLAERARAVLNGQQAEEASK
ncbi:MAG: ATP-binding protein, partial [Planctomycetales bacterium]